jgi:hypothetical protein
MSRRALDKIILQRGTGVAAVGGMIASLRLRILAFVILAAAAPAGCATPSPIVRLEPRTRNVVWVAGRAVVAKEKDGVRVATAFERQDGNLLAVRLEVENLTPNAIEVSPSRFTFATCPTADTESCVGAYSVVDPEEAIQALDQNGSRARAAAHNEAVLDTTLVLLSAVGDVATIADGKSDRTTGLTTVALAEHGQAAMARAEATQGSIEHRRQVWSDVAFRRSTVGPGHGASGLVYMPAEPSARYVWLYVEAGGRTFPFGFVQQVQRVEP